MKNSAIVLFAHGARDARWRRPLDDLQQALVRAQPQLRVTLAFLELQAPDLPAALDALAAEGIGQIDIAPIFWSRGGHIVRDLAQIVRDFGARHPQAQVRVLPVLAELPGMNDFIAQAVLAQAGAAG